MRPAPCARPLAWSGDEAVDAGSRLVEPDRPMELSGSLLIRNQLTVGGFSEGHPHILPKIAPLLRELVKMIGPGGIRQPIVATYPVDRVKEAVAHAVKGGRIF